MVVSHVDALVGVQGDRPALFNERDLDRGNIATGPIDHPSIHGLADSFILLSVSLICEQKKSLILAKNVNFLNATVDFFTRLEEETLRTVNQYLLAKLVLTLFIFRIEDIAELILAEYSHTQLLYETFVNINEVSRYILISD